jgi:hypothetical protein
VKPRSGHPDLSHGVEGSDGRWGDGSTCIAVPSPALQIQVPVPFPRCLLVGPNPVHAVECSCTTVEETPSQACSLCSCLTASSQGRCKCQKLPPAVMRRSVRMVVVRDSSSSLHVAFVWVENCHLSLPSSRNLKSFLRLLACSQRLAVSLDAGVAPAPLLSPNQ